MQSVHMWHDLGPKYFIQYYFLSKHGKHGLKSFKNIYQIDITYKSCKVKEH